MKSHLLTGFDASELNMEDMEFPGILNQEYVEIPEGSIKKEVEFPGGRKEKFMWNFHESWFLALEIPSVK